MIKQLLKFLSFAIFLALVGCTNSESGRKGEFTIAILHTNDVHGEIANYPKLASYKKELEKKYNKVLLVSAGDIFSGNAFIDFYEDKGYPMVDLMNKVGYDVAELGNHEFDYGQEIFAKRIHQADFPFICANIKTLNDSLPTFEPYKIFNIKGIKLLFLGLIQTGGKDNLPSTHPDNVAGYKFIKADDVLDQYASLKDSADAFIGLTHLGYKWDKSIAEKTNMFDVIIGGHSHTFIDSAEFVNNILITQTGDDLRYVGKTLLTFTDGILTKREYEVIKLDTLSNEDQQLAQLVKNYLSNGTLSKVLGKAASDIKGKQELGCLFNDAQVYTQGIDFAFQNGGGIRTSKIPAGDITSAVVYDLDPFGNNLVEFNLTVPEIQSLIRNSYQYSGEIDLYMGGGSYVINLDKDGKVKDIEIIRSNGQAVNPDSTYQVGLSSYIASKYKFDHADTGRSLNVTTADNLIKFIQQKGVIDYSGCMSAEVR